MMRGKSSTASLGGALLLTFAAFTGRADTCRTVDDVQLLIESMSDEGGYVLLFRHADKYAGKGEPRRPPELGRTLPETCSKGREAEVLNNHGVAQAKAIGAALVDVPVGNVYASTACRTIETAQLAFGKTPKNLDRSRVVEALTTRPEGSANTVIVSHSNIIADALKKLEYGGNQHLSCGEAVVFKPKDNGETPECLGRVMSNGWATGEPEELKWVNVGECDKSGKS